MFGKSANMLPFAKSPASKKQPKPNPDNNDLFEGAAPP